MSRVAVFFDWQNAYKSARRAFELEAMPNEYGNFCPLAVARLIASRNARGSSAELVLVEIHRGLPASDKDPIGHGAVRRQSQIWINRDPTIVIPRPRPLNYPHHSPSEPREKGVDVALAISMVGGAFKDNFDVGVLFSNDTDLVPVIQTIVDLKGRHAVETASWQGPGSNARLRGAGFHHFLDGDDFQRCEDRVNYAHAASRPRR